MAGYKFVETNERDELFDTFICIHTRNRNIQYLFTENKYLMNALQLNKIHNGFSPFICKVWFFIALLK